METVHLFKLPEGLRTPRLVGAFIAVIGLLLFFQAGAQMFETWENIKFVKSCFNSKSALPAFQGDCSQLAEDLIGVPLRPDQTALGVKQTFIAFVSPLVSLFFGVVVFIIGSGLYDSGKFVFPIQMATRKMKK